VADKDGFDVTNRANELQQRDGRDTVFGHIRAVVHTRTVAALAEESQAAALEHDRLNILRETLGMPSLPPPECPQGIPADKLVVNRISLKLLTLPGKTNKVFVAPGYIPGQKAAWRHEIGEDRNLWFFGKQNVTLTANGTCLM
jgi:hypothetical protein